MKNVTTPSLCYFDNNSDTPIKALLCDPNAGTGGVGVKEIGYGTSPTGKRRVIIRGAYMLQFITDGSGFFCGKKFGSGDVLFSVPNEPEVRITVKNEKYTCAWITFIGSHARTLMDECGITKSDSIKNDVFSCKRCAEAAKFLINAASLSYGERHGLELLSVLYNVLSMLDLNEKVKSISYVESARAYMINNCELPIKVSDVAKSVSLSQNYLCKLFLRECGHSIKRELTEIRLARACKLLQNKSLSIRDIAYAVGFSDEKHFSEVFRKNIGLTPRKYSQMNK